MRPMRRTIGIGSALTGVTAAAAVLVAPIASADSAVDPIINAVNGDRANSRCPALNYNGVLAEVAQQYANSELLSNSAPFDYQYAGETSASLGSGDPQSAAINSAYRNGAGREISQCRFTDFGVGFVRHEKRSVDVVTIIFGAPKAPPPSPVAAPDPLPVPVPAPAAEPPSAPKPQVETASTNADVDVYGEPGGVGSPGRVLEKNSIVTIKQRRDDNWVELVDIGWVWGDFLSPR